MKKGTNEESFVLFVPERLKIHLLKHGQCVLRACNLRCKYNELEFRNCIMQKRSCVDRQTLECFIPKCIVVLILPVQLCGL